MDKIYINTQIKELYDFLERLASTDFERMNLYDRRAESRALKYAFKKLPNMIILSFRGAYFFVDYKRFNKVREMVEEKMLEKLRYSTKQSLIV